jgi:AsmA protein
LKKIGKIIAIIVGAIVLLLIVAAVALVLLVDPNQYKDQITGLVKTQTGRELQINKKISLSFFPWLGVETGGLVLSNAPGFDKEPFARIEQAGVKVKLLPLLRGRVEVDTILLRGLAANLATDAKGRNNWDDLAGAPAPEKPTPAPEQRGGLPVTLAVGGIDISRARVTYADQGTGLQVTVRNLDLESGPLAAGKPVDLRLAFDFESSETKAPMHINLAATAAVDLERQTLNVPNLNLRAGDLVLRGNVAGKQIMDAPQFDGVLDLDPFNAKAWLADVIGPMETADKAALTRVGLRTKFSASAKNLRLQDLALGVDDTKLTGTASILNFAQPAYRFDLAVDRLTLDRYLPPETAAAPGQKPAPAPAAAPVVIPLDALRALDADGRLRVGQLQAFGLKSSEVLVKLFAKDGLVKMDPTQAKLYGGAYKGATSYDARTSNPQLSINEQLSNIQLGPFLEDAVDFDKFVGRGNVNAKFTARGMDAEEIKKTLNGTGGFAVHDGTLKGIDLARMIDEIETAIKQKTWQGLTNLVPRATDETKFAQLKGSVGAKNGVVSNDDLALQGPRIDVTGKGSASLPAQTIDYRLVVNKAPILVGGTFAKPTYKPDWNAIVKGQAEKRIEKEKGKLEEKLKEKLDERLKGLFKR